MRSFFPALLVLLPPGCAAATPAPQPPVAVIPVPPAVPDTKGSAAAAPTPPEPSGVGVGSTWTTELSRREELAPVARCQIVPVEMTTALAAEQRVTAVDDGRPTEVAVRIIQDREQAKGSPPPPSLEGKSYVVEGSEHGLVVHTAAGGPVPQDEARRVAALASTTIGWPGLNPRADIDTSALGDAVRAVVDAHMHGVPATKVDVQVHACGRRRESWGDAFAFDVTLYATESDAGMCHRWTNDARLAGELLLRARDGALVSLRLAGPTSDTEAVCQGNTTPRTCNEGAITFEVRQPTFAAQTRPD
jgi:hypothetical protein